MSKKQILEDVPLMDRENQLADSATRTEELEFRREFTHEERDQMAHDFSEKFAKHQRLCLQVKEQIKALKGQISDSNEEIYSISGRIQNGYEEVEETVYLQDDQEKNRMYYYDRFGTLIKERALRPDERGKQIDMFDTKAS